MQVEVHRTGSRKLGKCISDGFQVRKQEGGSMFGRVRGIKKLQSNH